VKSLSFDPIASYYDETRTFNEGHFREAIRYLSHRFPPAEYTQLFEPGIGTGRIAIPRAQQGYQVTGIDISKDMLSILKSRLSDSNLNLPISFQKGDVCNLPFSSPIFDITVVVHLFYFLKEWGKAADEILRVVKPNCPIVLMHTGMGMEIPLLNERYKELCAEFGHPIDPIGVTSTKEVIAHFSDLGCNIEVIKDRWKWTSCIQLKRAISYLRLRAYSFTTFAPEDAHSHVIERIEKELKDKYGNLATHVEVPNEIYLVVLSKP
jgi:ubiquinone/menaquinone biosynthesis C-methylase UbiE